MAKIFGRDYTRDELRRFMGEIGQVAGIRLSELSDGPARGVRIAEFYTGSGFRFAVLLDRGMDIGDASFNGKPMAWLAPVGVAHPAHYEPEGLGWLRTFGGGLMTGCGMTWYGPPIEDKGQQLGLHGRLSHLPARSISTGAEWQGDEYIFWIQGEIRETVVFGDHLTLTRRISARLGGQSLHIEDRVENSGFSPAEHMMLYHCNFGFPVISPNTEFIIDDMKVEPRDDVAAPGLPNHTRFESPVPGYAEQVFYHQPRPDKNGIVTARLVNRVLDFGAYVNYRADTLPYLAQWKMMGAGEYVCGLEPATTWVGGRAKAREDGQLRVLAPGEIVTYDVEIGALAPGQQD
jgi:hypothetical protein